MSERQRAELAVSILRAMGMLPTEPTDIELERNGGSYILKAKDELCGKAVPLIAKLKKLHLKGRYIAHKAHIDAGALSRLAHGDPTSLSLESLRKAVEAIERLLLITRTEYLAELAFPGLARARVLGFHGHPDTPKPVTCRALDILMGNLSSALFADDPTLEGYHDDGGFTIVLDVDGHLIFVSDVPPTADPDDMLVIADHEIAHQQRFVEQRKGQKPGRPASAFGTSKRYPSGKKSPRSSFN